jgi:hypothetical protein
MKVLFLDCDGVLNSELWFTKTIDALSTDPVAVARLHRILQMTDAAVVLSSTWRLVPDLVEQLKALIPIIDLTPRLDGNGCRCDEIRLWLKDHPDVTEYAILDDDPDAGYGMESHFVQTDWHVGMTAEDADKVIAILNAKDH